ncbi:MATE family efflux transporter [Yeguia hominis]|uniref:MATE family efflux transporter n=1 Tax=Yeguia hominis TaxID=2763662 RepID=A0A926D8R5_9FIRM|nr:MATE family efflux transporter [Yeguia hominis]MBC8533791.1 MATE family efflux transporter [Yeguia hominis]
MKQQNKAFLREALRLTLPISMQFLVASAVNLADVIMLGRLGDEQVAAAGAANQIFFLLNLISFGIFSGASVFLAQFWGAKDVRNTRRTIGMMYILGITAALLFTVGAIFLPRTLINFYAHEASVIDYGAGYLSIVGISYVPTVIGFALSVVCRSTGNMKLPTFTSVLSMMINIVGNAILIFGLLGAPALGVNGAAIATVIARTVECAVLVFFIYRHKMAGAATFRELFCFDRMFVRRYVKTTAPVLINETLWSIGTSLYSVAFGLLGTNAVAAVQIANTIAQMLLVFVRGAGNAAAIMIGNKIGAGKEEEAFADSKRFMILMLVIGSVVCVAVILLRPLILSIYNVSDETLQFANELLLLHGLTTIPDSINMLVIVGVCRSGGDTKFACLLDTLSVWLLGMPLGFLGVYLGFPLWAVFLCVSTEKIAKPILGIPRVYSKKWINNVVSDL